MPKQRFSIRHLPEPHPSRGDKLVHRQSTSYHSSRNRQLLNHDAIEHSQGQNRHHAQPHLKQTQPEHSQQVNSFDSTSRGIC